jgi:replicative DNA helicase
LLLIGGAQGTGKTTMALQMARNVASGGLANVLYICFEHEEQYLLNRLVALESALAHLPQKTGAIKIQDVRKEIMSSWMGEGSGGAGLTGNQKLRPSLDRIARYGQNLFLMRGSQTASTVENIHKLVQQHRVLSGDRRLLVVVDYLQKVPMHPEPNTEAEKVTYIVNGLKDIALSEQVPMISIVAADKEGLKAQRLRNHHLRGSSAINYEADIILIINEKYQIVAKVNIEFNPYQAQRFRDWVIVTVEKNRGGQDNIDLEYEKHFEYSCFDPNGRTVQEKLIEERLYNERRCPDEVRRKIRRWLAPILCASTGRPSGYEPAFRGRTRGGRGSRGDRATDGGPGGRADRCADSGPAALGQRGEPASDPAVPGGDAGCAS